MKMIYLLLFFCMIGIVSAQTTYSDCTIYGNCKPVQTGTTFNNNTGSVNSSAWWGSYYFGDYNMPLIKTFAYNQTYTGGTYNSTYNIWAYNQTSINDITNTTANNTFVPYTGAINNVVLGNHNLTYKGVLNISDVGTNAVVIGDVGGNAKGSRAINIQGARATSTSVASGDDCVVLGYDTSCTFSSSVAIGYSAKATTGTCVALGASSSCTSGGPTGSGTAIGFNAQATATNTATLGASSSAQALGCTAMGASATCSGAGSTVIGQGATDSGATGVFIYSSQAPLLTMDFTNADFNSQNLINVLDITPNNIYPATNNTYDLGSQLKWWKKLWVSNIQAKNITTTNITATKFSFAGGFTGNKTRLIYTGGGALCNDTYISGVLTGGTC